MLQVAFDLTQHLVGAFCPLPEYVMIRLSGGFRNSDTARRLGSLGVMMPSDCRDGLADTFEANLGNKLTITRL